MSWYDEKNILLNVIVNNDKLFSIDLIIVWFWIQIAIEDSNTGKKLVPYFFATQNEAAQKSHNKIKATYTSYTHKKRLEQKH